MANRSGGMKMSLRLYEFDADRVGQASPLSRQIQEEMATKVTALCDLTGVGHADSLIWKQDALCVSIVGEKGFGQPSSKENLDEEEDPLVLVIPGSRLLQTCRETALNALRIRSGEVVMAELGNGRFGAKGP